MTLTIPSPEESSASASTPSPSSSLHTKGAGFPSEDAVASGQKNLFSRDGLASEYSNKKRQSREDVTHKTSQDPPTKRRNIDRGSSVRTTQPFDDLKGTSPTDCYESDHSVGNSSQKGKRPSHDECHNDGAHSQDNSFVFLDETSDSRTNISIASYGKKNTETESDARDIFIHEASSLKRIISMSMRRIVEFSLSGMVSATSSSLPGSAADKHGEENGEQFRATKRKHTSRTKDRNGLDNESKDENYGKDTYQAAVEMAEALNTERIILKRTLKEKEAHIKSLERQHSAMNAASSQASSRIDRLNESLRNETANSSEARADADTARAQADGLRNVVDALRNVVEETKVISHSLQNEHDELSNATQEIEERIRSKTLELKRAKNEVSRTTAETNLLKTKLQSSLENESNKSDQLRKVMMELDREKTLESQRSEENERKVNKIRQLESELSEVQGLLVEATERTSEHEVLIGERDEILQEIRDENQSLHERLDRDLKKAGAERDLLGEELTKQTASSQRTEMKLAETEEECARLRRELGSAERQAKSKIASLERRLNDRVGSASGGGGGRDRGRSRSAVPPPSYPSVPPAQRYGRGGDPAPTSSGNLIGSSLLKIAPASLAASASRASPASASGRPHPSNCSVCGGPPFGLMKRCQCGVSGCDRRAHAKCLTAGSILCAMDLG
eukprot:CAMPEP_0194321802 /NCGR_PEP_ID=MMETSP0171-20130528/17995_1 /TAXON_ID=218684 /ORGANISM="Corethron pennatum, Strain L29A3" /LENGTH=680 /DNA_ID=CAMNT_0039079829 /DNA_START=34 /DNA_END=2076 /DNA_ORIENTATION=-